MNVNYLKELNDLVDSLLKNKEVLKTIKYLKDEVSYTDDTFVWSVIEPEYLSNKLPANLKSGWIFVLKKGTPSGCHYHPNSVQHMVMIEGTGESKVGGVSKKMSPFGSPDQTLEETWYVIEEGVEHEFSPEERDMVVISFHTCEANKLEEISCNSNQSRFYES